MEEGRFYYCFRRFLFSTIDFCSQRVWLLMLVDRAREPTIIVYLFDLVNYLEDFPPVGWLLSTSADRPLADAALCELRAPFTCNFENLLLTLEERLLLVDQPFQTSPFCWWTMKMKDVRVDYHLWRCLLLLIDFCSRKESMSHFGRLTSRTFANCVSCGLCE